MIEFGFLCLGFGLGWLAGYNRATEAHLTYMREQAEVLELLYKKLDRCSDELAK